MASDSSKKEKPLNRHQILSGFNQLRQAQRLLSDKIIELENDLNEHKYVAKHSDLSFQAIDQRKLRVIISNPVSLLFQSGDRCFEAERRGPKML